MELSNIKSVFSLTGVFLFLSGFEAMACSLVTFLSTSTNENFQTQKDSGSC